MLAVIPIHVRTVHSCTVQNSGWPVRLRNIRHKRLSGEQLHLLVNACEQEFSVFRQTWEAGF